MNSSPVSNEHPALYSDLVARRRALVLMAKNSEGTVVANEETSEFNNDTAAIAKDLSQTAMREAVLERAREFLRLRKGVLTASVYSRPKKSLHRRRRFRVSNVLSIITKTALLVAALFYIGQLIWRWTASSHWDTRSSFSSLEYEDQISEVQKSLKITTKMLQAQVQVIDKKIGTEIGIVTRELKKHVEERGELIEKELKRLESVTDDLVYSLADLEKHGPLIREELEKFWIELKSKTNIADVGKSVDLDDIMELTRSIVAKEIEKHASDGLGRVDYALASGGARVVRHSEPYVYGKASSWLAVAKSKTGVHPSAQKMLEPSFGEPGQCFPLQGSSGFVEIRLREGIIPEAITLEHVSKSVAYDRSSAPKDCQVSGWYEGPEDDSSAEIVKFSIDFSYDLEQSNVQTFAVPMIDSGTINMVRLNFTSNHGSSSLTCIYRIRVHGYKPSPHVAAAGHAQVIEQR